MKTRLWLVAIAGTLATQADVFGLTPPKESDGPIRLLNCIVSPQGVLEAEVDNQADEAQSCAIRCNYDFEGKRLSHTFGVTIPPRFHGRIGRFETQNATAGNYSGEVGACEPAPR